MCKKIGENPEGCCNWVVIDVIVFFWYKLVDNRYLVHYVNIRIMQLILQKYVVLGDKLTRNVMQ